MATTTLTGTTGNDLLNAPGALVTEAVGLEGNDTINLALATDTARAGKGNDSITITRNGALLNTIFGGQGNDTVTLLSAATIQGQVTLGEGDDRFVLTAGNMVAGLVQGNQGNDVVTFTSTVTNSTIGGGQGNDSITFDTGANAVTTQFFGAKGADTLILRANAANSNVTLQGSEGHDRIFVTANGTFSGQSIIAAGKGLDSITINNQFIASVAGGLGDDTITSVAAGFASGIIFGDSNGNTTGTDADGADTISSTAGFVGNGSIYGGGGADTISFRSGAGAFFVDGGTGHDLIGTTALNMTAGGTIQGGAGIDTLSVGAVSSNTLSAAIFGGAGADSITLSLANTAGQVSINGGEGADTITLATGMVTALAGSTFGTATINGGDGADSINIQSTVLSGSLFATGFAETSITAASGVVMNYVYGAGDTLAFGTATTIGSTAVNWRVGAPTIYNATSFSAMVSAIGGTAGTVLNGTGAGTMAVFDSGDDLIIALRGVTSAAAYINVIGGGSLIGEGNGLTTGAFTMNTSNFGFSVTELATNGGFNITFA